MSRRTVPGWLPLACGVLLGVQCTATAQERLQALPGESLVPTTNVSNSATQPLPTTSLYAPTAQEFPQSPLCCAQENCPEMPHFFGGGDYIFLRPHFSEAVGFAMVTDTLGAGGLNRQVDAQELDFHYESSMRFFLGYHLNECADIRFTYWYVDTDTTVGGTAGAGQTIVDPFGNTGLTGSSINTSAAIKLNVFDVEYQRAFFSSLRYSAGLKFADVNQFYDSLIVNGQGATTSTGVFNVDFFGVGPYLGLSGEKCFGARKHVSLFAKGAAALLVGEYEISNGLTIPGLVTGAQTADRIRTVPMMESELGITWAPESCFSVSAGWMFQAWMNLGTSGGTFNGTNLPIAPTNNAFGGADDSDIMSFDGLFVRGEVTF